MPHPNLPEGILGLVTISGTPERPRITGQVDFHNMKAEEAGILFGALVAWSKSAADRFLHHIGETSGPDAMEQAARGLLRGYRGEQTILEESSVSQTQSPTKPQGPQ